MFESAERGGHLLSFAGSRTQHRMAVNIEDAGFEVRDMLAWVYGSGFRNLIISVKQLIECRAMREHPQAKQKHTQSKASSCGRKNRIGAGAFGQEVVENVTKSISEDGMKWEVGHSLKARHRADYNGRKPFKGSVTANVLKHGTGA